MKLLNKLSLILPLLILASTTNAAGYHRWECRGDGFFFPVEYNDLHAKMTYGEKYGSVWSTVSNGVITGNGNGWKLSLNQNTLKANMTVDREFYHLSCVKTQYIPLKPPRKTNRYEDEIDELESRIDDLEYELENQRR